MVFAWTLGTYAVFTTASGYLQQFQDATVWNAVVSLNLVKPSASVVTINTMVTL